MTDAPGILFVTNTLVTGGAERVLVDLTLQLHADGRYRPIVACLKERGSLAEPLIAAGIPVYEKLLADRFDVRALWRLRQIVVGEGVRIVVPTGSGGDRMFWSVLTKLLTDVKVVVWSHIYTQPGRPSFETVNRALYPFVDRFVALGRRHRRSLAKLDKAASGQTTIIPNGIPVETFDHPEWRDRARAILGLGDDNVTAIAMIANLRPDKRHDLFIAAARDVVRQRRDVHFFIIGDGPCRADVQRWVQQSELQGQFISMLGQRNDIAQLLPGLDLLVLCSEYHECLSIAAMQGLAAHVPTVSSFVGSMDDLITDNETGFFFRPLSSQALAQRILDIASQTDLRKTVAQKGYERVLGEFTVERMMQRFVHLFDELLAADLWKHVEGRRTNHG
jgi:glycosyltransferase involved in cell wall biosynthesis